MYKNEVIMNKKSVRNFLSVTIIGFLLIGCFPGGGSSMPDDPAGFFSGIWHGWIAPISLIYGLFNDSISVYEIHAADQYPVSY